MNRTGTRPWRRALAWLAFLAPFFYLTCGALLGLSCMWLWPEPGTSPLATAALATDRRRLVVATRYLIGGSLIAALAVWIGGAGLWLLWPAMSLALVSANYAVFGPEGFQKKAAGFATVVDLCAELPASRWWSA